MTDAAISIVPENEPERLDAIRRYDILDTPPDGAFDRVSQLAARICGTPISTITIVDQDRIWFKSAHGIDGVTETGRDPGLCASAVMQLEPYLVEHASIDPRTLGNPLVCGELGLEFYAAVPLTTADGHNLGTLNVIDLEPRTLTDDQIASLRDLAAIIMDELELRLTARATVELEAAKEAARFRDAIVAGVSHEMRTPLAILQGLASLDPAGDTSPEEAEQIRTLQRRQIRHLDWLVRQFLDYASIEDDRTVEVDLEPTDLEDVIADACDVFRGECAISIEADDGLPPALADHDRTRQIVLELLNNAIRFGDGEEVEVTLRTGDDGTIEVAVTDHGRGLDPGLLDRIWDKSFRGRDSTGTGLGLYVTKVFAEAQGGRVEVRSEPGVGSTFTLVLPCVEAA